MKRSPPTKPSAPSQPPTSFPRNASAYAGSLTRGRRGTDASTLSSKISAPSFKGTTTGSSSITSPSSSSSSSLSSSSRSSKQPTHRRRTSSLTSIDKFFSGETTGGSIASTLKRALHLRSSSKASLFPSSSKGFDTRSTRANSSVRARSRSPSPTPSTRTSHSDVFQFPGAVGAPPNIPLPLLPPPPSLIPSTSLSSLTSSTSSSRSRYAQHGSQSENVNHRSRSSSSASSSSSFNDVKGDKALPGVPVGRDRDLLMWRTEAMTNRRAGFICTTEHDLAALRLRTEDDGAGEPLSWEEFGLFLDKGGKESLSIGNVLVQPRSEVKFKDRSAHTPVECVDECSVHPFITPYSPLSILVPQAHSRSPLPTRTPRRSR